MNSRSSQRGYASRGQERGYAEYRHVSYYYGSAAPALEPEEKRGEERGNDRARRQSVSYAVRPAEKRRRGMNPAMIVFMVTALCAVSLLLVGYIGLESAVTNAVEEIAELETELSELRSDNDEALSEINANISLDDIKYRAIAELGMTYAQEDQIIYYSNEDSDYVKQVIQPD